MASYIHGILELCCSHRLRKNIATWPISVDARSKGVGLRPLTSRGSGFESRRGHGCLSLVSIVCCEVEVSASGRSPVRRSRTECGVSLSVIVKPRY
jgi:hypothetical protein